MAQKQVIKRILYTFKVWLGVSSVLFQQGTLKQFAQT